MADEVNDTETQDDQEFLNTLLEDEPDDTEEPFQEEAEEAEQKYEKADDKVLREVKQLREQTAKIERDRQIEKLHAEFEKKASPAEREWLSIMETGKEEPKQLKALMELAHQKGKAASAKIAAKVEDESSVDDALQSWGLGPIQTERAKPDVDNEEQALVDAWERSKRGDTKAWGDLIMNHRTVAADLKNR